MLIGMAGLAAEFLLSCTSPILSSQEPFFYRIHNDLPQVVIVQRCDDPACTHYAETHQLPPGRSTREMTYPDGTPRSWKVVTPPGQLIGCMPFRFHARLTKDKSFGVSTNVPCGTTGGVDSAGSGDWPSS